MPSFDREKFTDMVSRLLVGVLFLFLSINLLREFLQTGHLTGLLLLTSEALVVVLTVLRRRATAVDRTAAAAIVTTVSVLGPPLVRASGSGGPLPDIWTAGLSAVGLLLVIAGKVVLGRSFGLVPANRGIVASGPYLLVRHPIYSGYLITHIGFLLAHPSAWNIGVLVVADTALVVRALYEERILVRDERYRDYCSRVGWHLVPGVF
jgi:protein-S-isoprenylcysteine O-methyltransferase Ste14